MASKPLSNTMIGALVELTEAGEFVRFVGGYWAKRSAPRDHNGVPIGHVGTSTVQALVARGVAQYSEWKDGRRGRFPIAVRPVAQVQA